MNSHATTNPFTEARDLYRTLGEIGVVRRQFEDAGEALNRLVGDALLEVRGTPLTIGKAAELLGVSRGTAYERMEETRQRRAAEARSSRAREGAGR